MTAWTGLKPRGIIYMYTNMAPSPSETRSQKHILLLVAVIGLATAALGILSLRKNIFTPFMRTGPLMSFKSDEEIERERTEAQKRADTDKDGLNDYDELYVFRTSPFLEDSDSDGANDGVEVGQGADPNCPQGRICGYVRPDTSGGAAGSAPSTAPGAAAGQPATAEAALGQLLFETFGDITQMTPEQITAKVRELPEDQLRDFLVKMGLPADQVKEADAASLRQLLEETFKDLGGQTGGTPAAPQ